MVCLAAKVGGRGLFDLDADAIPVFDIPRLPEGRRAPSVLRGVTECDVDDGFDVRGALDVAHDLRAVPLAGDHLDGAVVDISVSWMHRE